MYKIDSETAKGEKGERRMEIYYEIAMSIKLAHQLG